MAPKIWDLVPKEMKQVTTLNEFKAKIKIWKLNCPCQLCRTYLPQIGFINRTNCRSIESRGSVSDSTNAAVI